MSIALAASFLLAACAQSPADEPPDAYVALGDSYSSGVGAGRYVLSSGACQRSKQSWVYGLGRPVSSFRACAGATTGTVLAGQLRAFPANTRLVTISIGGNDAGFVEVLTTCLLSTPARCSARVTKAERFVRRTLPARLDRVYDAIRRRAPKATVLVVGYPRLFAGRPCGSAGQIDVREQRRLNDASNALARTTAATVRRHSGFRFVDVREAFNGAGVCSPAPRIQGVIDPMIDAFHPNMAGYRTYARVVKARL